MITEFDWVEILDWYDNIINAFCKTKDETYYCGLLAMNSENDDKIYFCISLKFFKKEKEISEIIGANAYKENWDRFSDILTKINSENESYLIKTRNLGSPQIEVVKYKDNFKWPRRVLFNDYPDVLDNAMKLDDWWSYFNIQPEKA